MLYPVPKTNTFDVRQMIFSRSTIVRIFSRYFHSSRCWMKLRVRPQAQNGRGREGAGEGPGPERGVAGAEVREAEAAKLENENVGTEKIVAPILEEGRDA